MRTPPPMAPPPPPPPFISVCVDLDHLPSSSAYPTPLPSHRLPTLLIPHLPPSSSVLSSLKRFIFDNLSIPPNLQLLSAPLFSVLADHEIVEDIYGRYCCHADADTSDLHVDEESFTFFAREKGQEIELRDDDRLDQRHIFDSCRLRLKVLPRKLPDEGGRIFVEMSSGILPIQGVGLRTSVLQIKKTIENLTGIPASQQLLSSVGRVMHDEFKVEDFDGVHGIYEDSTLDLCRSGDSNAEQSHRRMPVKVKVKDGLEFTVVVQGRDTVRTIIQLVESRTGCASWQQKILFSGRLLDEKKTLSDYFIYPDCTLHVNIFRKGARTVTRSMAHDLQEQPEPLIDEESKPLARKIKLVRTLKGMVMGTVTIPVLTTDTIVNLRKKIKRSLQPLVERNLSMPTPRREPRHIDITPRCSPASTTKISSIKSTAASSRVSNSPSLSAENVEHRVSNLENYGVSRPRLSSTSTPLNICQTKSFSTSLSSSSVFAAFSPSTASRIQLEHPSQCQSGSKLTPARKLDFDSTVFADQNGPWRTNEESLSQIEAKQDHKRSFGAWINTSVHALTEQLRAQLIEH